MRQFLEQLFSTGEVSVVPPGFDFEIGPEVDVEIRRFAWAARLSLAGDAPVLLPDVAVWSARMLAEISRLTIARELGADYFRKIFASQCPLPRSPEVDFSADLFLQYLPGLVKLVERLAADDPLAVQLRKFGGEWPLSSVGIKGIQVSSIDSFIEHPSLRQLYVDRILATSDISRLTDERVVLATRATLGAHPELSSVVAKTIGIVAGTPE